MQLLLYSRQMASDWQLRETQTGWYQLHEHWEKWSADEVLNVGKSGMLRKPIMGLIVISS